MHHILHKQIYAGLAEILKDKRLYYHSTAGASYCHLTDEGEKAVLEWMTLMAPKMVELEAKELDARAKALVLAELKQ